MLFAIVIGILGGVGISFLAARRLVTRVADRFAPQRQGRNFVAVCALVFGAIALTPAIFLSVMGAGSLGVPVAEGLARALGLGGFFISLVLILEVMAATVLTVTGHAALGAGLGALAARSLGSVGRRGGSGPQAAKPE